MQDSENDISRIENGLNTTRGRKYEVQRNVEWRNTNKERLLFGKLSPYDFCNTICHTLIILIQEAKGEICDSCSCCFFQVVFLDNSLFSVK